MKITCLTLFWFIINSLAIAQKAEWSAPEKSEHNYVSIIGQDEEGFYVLKSNLPINNNKQTFSFKKREYVVSYYGFNLSLKWSQNIGVSKESKVEQVVFFNEKILLLKSVVNADKTVSLKAQYFLKGIESIEYLVVASASKNKSEFENISFLISKNQSKLALLLSPPKNEDKISAIILDASLKVLYNKSLDENAAFGQNFIITNDGNLAWLREKREKKIISHQFNFYNRNIDNYSSFEINSEGKELVNPALIVNENKKNLVLTGFYLDKDNSTTGVFYSSLSIDSLQTPTIKTTAFDEQFVSRIIGERKKGKSLIDIDNYYIKKPVLRSDNGAVLMAENFFTTTSSYYDVFMQIYVTRTNYHYNSILVISINPNGSIDWSQVINKAQTSTEDGGFYSSYCSLPYQDKIYFFYNDFERSNRVLQSTITTKGESSSTAFFKGSEEVQIMAKAAKQIDANTLIVPALKEEKFYFLKITF